MKFNTQTILITFVILVVISLAIWFAFGMGQKESYQDKNPGNERQITYDESYRVIRRLNKSHPLTLTINIIYGKIRHNNKEFFIPTIAWEVIGGTRHFIVHDAVDIIRYNVNTTTLPTLPTRPAEISKNTIRLFNSSSQRIRDYLNNNNNKHRLNNSNTPSVDVLNDIIQSDRRAKVERQGLAMKTIKSNVAKVGMTLTTGVQQMRDLLSGLFPNSQGGGD